jgi:pilus assembly protein CpaD
MKPWLYPIALPLALALAGCVTDYTKSEAPNNLRVDGAERRAELPFIPGTARLAHGDTIEKLVATGQIRPSDRVTIAAGGPPGLAAQRSAVIASELLRYGIVADPSPLDNVPANQAILDIGRYTVTLPPCPNWSEYPDAEYTNAYRSNWGCAAATNLGLMVAKPADLVSGRSLGPHDATSAVAAVTRYYEDRVKEPPAPTASPFAATPGGAGGAGAGGAGGAGATGAGVGTGGTP